MSSFLGNRAAIRLNTLWTRSGWSGLCHGQR